MSTNQSHYLVTGNQGKLAEFQRILPMVHQVDIHLPEIQSLDPKEVIAAKLEAARQHHTDGILMVEDTSLELGCFNGLPGTFIKWFEQTMGLEEMAQKAATLGDTTALARTMIGLLDEQGQTHFFEGIVEGDFVPPRGDQDFGWGPCFQLKGETRTFGEMSREEKDQHGMRAQALRAVAEFLES